MAVLAMVAVGVMAGAGSSAVGGAASVNVSTRAGVVSYLRSLGIDPRGVVVQRGAHNYAGPTCAGRGGTCTTAKRVLQIATTASSTNKFVCAASTPATISPTSPTDCTIVQVSIAGGVNSATCLEQSTNASVAQNCSISQTNTTGTNQAVISQGVSVNAGPIQYATQYGGVDQENSTGSNSVNIGQGLAQSTADPSGQQTQDGHQQVYVNQSSSNGGTSAGANSARVSQSLSLKAQAMGVDSISQLQNTKMDPLMGWTNSNAWVSQTSDQGRNSASVNQANAYDAHAGNASIATQQQGTPASLSGGLAVFFTQHSGGVSTISSRQREKQNLHAEHVGLLTQNQYGPMWSDPDQFSNSGNTYNISQSSDQNASNPSVQKDSEYADCNTSGNCTAKQAIHRQGEPTHMNSCTGSFCDISLTELPGDGGPIVTPCVAVPSDLEVAFAPSTCFPDGGEPSPPPAPVFEVIG